MARTFSSNILSAIVDGTFFVDGETPTGALNGSNQTFTLAGSPNPAGSLEVYVNGQKMAETEDYTLSGDTLTTGVAYPSGTILRVSYRVTPA